MNFLKKIIKRQCCDVISEYLIMGCNTSKEAMQAVENNAENNKEKLQNLSKQGETILNNVADKAGEKGGSTEDSKLEDDDLVGKSKIRFMVIKWLWHNDTTGLAAGH